MAATEIQEEAGWRIRSARCATHGDPSDEPVAQISSWDPKSGIEA